MSPSAPLRDGDDVERRRIALETRERELETFIHTLAHDLNDHVRTIEGFTHLVLQKHRADLDPEVVRHLEHVEAAGQKMAELIGSLSGLARGMRDGAQE